LSDDEKPKGARIIDWQLKRPEYGEALRSYHKPLPNDERFRKLLRRLDTQRDFLRYRTTSGVSGTGLNVVALSLSLLV